MMDKEKERQTDRQGSKAELAWFGFQPTAPTIILQWFLFIYLVFPLGRERI